MPHARQKEKGEGHVRGRKGVRSIKVGASTDMIPAKRGSRAVLRRGKGGEEIE